MFPPSSTPAALLPTPRLTTLRPGLSLLSPLSRRGTGPGLIVVCPETADSLAIVNGVPWPLVKWAEEGYTVVQVQPEALVSSKDSVLKEACEALSSYVECAPKEKVAIVVYGGLLWNDVAAALSSQKEIVAAVVYASASDANILKASPVPLLQHLAGSGPSSGQTLQRVSPDHTRYWYSSAQPDFAVPFQPGFHYATESVSHTRSLMFLKARMGGPSFDLEQLWDEHTYYEFGDRSVEHTMSTMVQEPYVNHVPTLTGGIGRASLSAFYRHHFIFSNSDDTALELISRTVGIDRVVDEFVFRFTHDRVVDWLVPGIPPTHKKVEVPFTAVVNFRGDRLYHEHIAWDQACVLRQLGLLPEYLPFPYALDGKEGQTLEYRLPVAGIESAEKLREKNAVSSNKMFTYGVREVKSKEDSEA
ncbi:hypothetical protein SEUCBS139899_008660 [Sporothrix eucalyptigena]|uniref:Carboxymethylenebutenolidase n=1 Tax=Sporothrix eucalyptigena TaxID=1812306 RepID=A0ABP0CQ38_9PEZI